MELLHNELTDKIIQAFYTVYNELGYGFLEKVYEHALRVELASMGFSVEIQKPITVFYKGQVVGEYFADLLVQDTIILELKTAETISDNHENQLINYLKATGKEVGLVLNFGKKPELKRKVYQFSGRTNQDKNRTRMTRIWRIGADKSL
jgi:GxxExxY protein